MSLFITAVLGVVIGVALGALGGGGSILTVPALVYVLGEGAQNATTTSLVIVGVTSAISALSYTRDRNVKWLPGLAFGASGIASSFLGSALNRSVDQHVLLLSFAGLMVVSAVGMLIKSRSRQPVTPTPALVAVGRTSTPLAGESREKGVPEVRAPGRRSLTVVQVVLAGLGIGFLTGFLGVGGGFLIVPALVMILRYPMPVAVGTSLLIISINSAASLLARVGHNHFDWSVIIPFTLAAIAGSLLGKRVADRLPARVLSRAFAGLIMVVAVYMGVQAL